MNFTSFHFVFFFFTTLVLGHLLKGRPQRIFLLAVSYYFYGVFEPYYLILILFSTAWDYLAGLAIAYRRQWEQNGGSRSLIARLPARFYLTASIIINLALLGYFKYTNFGITMLNDAHPLGNTVFAFPAESILLPVGISFYTFQSMSYTIDVYRGVLEARRDPVDFALYVTFFPQLVAGPIVRATTFLKQLDEGYSIGKNDIIVGVTRIIVGFFRKLVLSDNLAPVVNQVFGNPAGYGTLDIWVASLAFGWQIYLDFAGYTDIARGVARLFGYEFEINFLYPMAASSITDHWSRWHISLTTWIRDYVFIPLGGSRVGPIRTYLNIGVVWLATGIWHGAAYHFVAWGIWQFVMIAIHRVYGLSALGQRMRETGGLLYGIASRILLFFCLSFGFIWFRAPDMSTATLMQGRKFGFENLNESFVFNSKLLSLSNLHGLKEFIALLILLWVYELFFNKYQLEYFWKPENRKKLIGILIGMLYLIIAMTPAETPNFLYFQF
ncbi:MAG: MBOAT family protein [Leptospiraceae bacterium]|nr:MBOAT family protein [Leptospiraceae bacterium]